jgi:peptidoglycan/LPS O-acetylase OafA/YrhL
LNIKYRPEIDGLRAVAVVAVILYHAQITIFGHQPFKGGFIGVDIFFVISGYLITSIILKELITTGEFSFKFFYERRIRRIVPPMLIVMLASLPLAWMYLLPSSLIDFSKSILYSLGFSSNFYFWISGQVYGAGSGFLKPFLHTWSLAVEEQFYILFPIFLLIVFKFFKKYFAFVLISVFIISLGLADWGSRNYPSSTFYLIYGRVWELIIGSGLAYLEYIKRFNVSNKKFNAVTIILPSIGFILILLTIIFFKHRFPHPSLYTLIPVLSVCLIIYFSNKNEIITKVLSSKLFVKIGLISYSLYLWHFPFFAFDRITEFSKDDFFKKILIGVVILLLSIISYYFIEKPARNRKYKFKFILSNILLFSFILIFINSFIILKKGYPERVSEILRESLNDKPWDLLENSQNKKCFNNKERCIFNPTSNKRVFSIGDSHMASINSNLKDRVVKKDYSFVTSTVGGCLYFPGFNLVKLQSNKIEYYCNDNYFLDLRKTLNKERNSIIIFGGRFPLALTNYYFDNKEGGVEGEGKEWDFAYISTSDFDTIESSFKYSIKELSKENKIVLIYPIPEVGWHVLNKTWVDRANKFSNKTKLKNITTSYKVYKERTKSTFELLDSITGKNIYRVYPHQLFCNTSVKNRCVVNDDENFFYIDIDHPSIKGVELISDLILKQIKLIETSYK